MHGRRLTKLAAALAALTLAVASGCGDGPLSGPSEPTDEIEVATLGDSVSSGFPGWDPDPIERRLRIRDPNEQSQYQYWAERENPDLDFRNCGVPGNTTGQMATRLRECADGADVLVIQGGANDLSAGIPQERIIANLRRMVRQGRRLGLRVALADVLPRNNYRPADAIPELNEAIYRLGRAEEVPVLRFHDTLEDPDRENFIPLEWTTDGSHPTVEGHRRLGEQAFELP